MCACVMSTASTEEAGNGGSSQLRLRNSFRPWKRPQSTSTREPLVSIRYFEPVTVPAAPQNESVVMFSDDSCVHYQPKTSQLCEAVSLEGRNNSWNTRY